MLFGMKMGGFFPPFALVKYPFLQHCLEPALAVRIDTVIPQTVKIAEPFFPGPAYGFQVAEEYINTFLYDLHVAPGHICTVHGWVVCLGKIDPDAPVFSRQPACHERQSSLSFVHMG